MNLKNKHVTVIGLGNSGINAAILLDDIGAYVRVTDAHDTPDIRRNVEALEHRDIRLEIGGHTKDFVVGSGLVVVSPGIEDSSPPVKWATELGIPIISEMELGFRFCKGRIIAITGTNGKSTVTTLIGEILKDGGKDAVICGNIGNSLCGEAQRIKDGTLVVLEVSSFQLERIEKFKPHIAVILNITDDHLDRYKRFDDYFNEKLKVFSHQDADDILILNYDAANLRRLKDGARSMVLFYSRLVPANGAYVKGGDIFCSSSNGEEEKILSVSEIGLKGLHNLENVLASSLVGVLAGVGAGSIRNTIMNFKGLPHRFETVDTINGVDYIDDSKGTTVDSTYRALESCARPVILIAGGRDKNSDYSIIKDLVGKKVKSLILIGEARERIKKALGGVVDIYNARTMLEAVETAYGLAKENDLVLLSPMCSSFDMFKDYKERGKIFKDSVRMAKKNSVKILEDAG